MSFSGDAGTARAFFQAIAKHDHDAASEYTADHIQVTSVATGDIYTGRRGFVEFARGWVAAFPDLRFDSLRISESNGQAAAEYVLEGTHTGPLITPRGHVPATGMEIQVRFCDILDVEDGRITAIRSYFDSVTMLRQLGLAASTPLHAADRRAALDLYAQPIDGNAPQRHKAIVHRFVQEVFNRQNPAASADSCRNDYVWHGGALGEARGLGTYQTVLASFFLAFPDLEIQILDTVAESDRVVARFSMSGTHLGHFQGVAPTYKRISGGGTNTYRIEESWIVEEWWQGDLLVILQQMDAVPASLRLSS